MINSISDQNGQKLILQVLQLLSEYEYIVKLFTEMKGEENPVDLLKSLSEQAEPIQIEFLRWVRGERNSFQPKDFISQIILVFGNRGHFQRANNVG